MEREVKSFFVYFIFSAFVIHAQGISLIDEYKLLHTDLLNLHTRGYKSFYFWTRIFREKELLFREYLAIYGV
jgi:hypothetical protein